ncbi:phosphotransferase [Demequina sp. TMPB413]|uniref:phosphotransferase n=1 Tax=unclassified Demequina TaxID=2620311 RepID=UPI001CF40D94|nr:phosphotransferase [Demequina sp. TMPB413]UPU88504.1 phosphotransferase [Demequina sp. TMPB413]
MLTPRTGLAIDAALVRRLLDSQFPEAHSLAIGAHCEGRDSIVWRLGEQWAIRLPLHERAAAKQTTETVWLPTVGRSWPFAAPVPVRVGKPSADFPWAWTVVPWLKGTPAHVEPLDRLGVAQLGAALRALHTPAPADAPRHPLRSLALLQRSDRVADKINALAATPVGSPWRLDARAAARVFQQGATTPRPAAAWTHLDLHPGNVLTDDGELAGIVDWSESAAGDPAADLGQALVLVGQDGWDALTIGYGPIDARTFARARAEGVFYALAFAAEGTGARATAGWAGLEALGVAHRSR